MVPYTEKRHGKWFKTTKRMELSEIKQTSCDKSFYIHLFFFVFKENFIRIFYFLYIYRYPYLLYFLHELNFKSNNITKLDSNNS